MGRPRNLFVPVYVDLILRLDPLRKKHGDCVSTIWLQLASLIMQTADLQSGRFECSLGLLTAACDDTRPIKVAEVLLDMKQQLSSLATLQLHKPLQRRPRKTNLTDRLAERSQQIEHRIELSVARRLGKGINRVVVTVNAHKFLSRMRGFGQIKDEYSRNFPGQIEESINNTSTIQVDISKPKEEQKPCQVDIQSEEKSIIQTSDPTGLNRSPEMLVYQAFLNVTKTPEANYSLTDDLAELLENACQKWYWQVLVGAVSMAVSETPGIDLSDILISGDNIMRLHKEFKKCQTKQRK